MASLLSKILAEVHENVATGIHPTVAALTDAFLNYLKEPRYQNPLSLSELARLFSAFYADLNSLVINIYTHLNTNKRQLLSASKIFQNDPKQFDYLLAIASYSSNSIKLVKRTDDEALFQLRVFAYYKFLTIMDTIEKAQYDLFSSASEKSTLYDKIFRFDERDIAIQRLLSEKIRILRELKLPLSCFCESESEPKLDGFFSSLDQEDSNTLIEIQQSFKLLNSLRTPATKLKYIVKTQKLLIKLLSSYYDKDTSKVNSDILLPALIYVIVYHLPEEDDTDHDLFLNFTFVKNFLSTIEPHKTDAAAFPLNTPLAGYNPTEKRRVRDRKFLSSSLFELMNLNETGEETGQVLDSDRALTNHLQATHFNNGELQYYLTNFEAILYFLLNSTIEELIPAHHPVPDEYKDNDLMTMPLHRVLETKQEPPLQEEFAKKVDEELEGNRSRSNSLFNTITSAVSQSVNRSRSNLALKLTGTINKEIFPHSTDFESSIYSSPLALSDRVDYYGLGRVRNFLGRIGLVLNIQFKPLDEEGEDYFGTPHHNETRSKRSSTLFDKISPHHSRTRSGSLETAIPPTNLHGRKPSLSAKLTSGVTEFMTKLSTAGNAVPSTLQGSPAPPAITVGSGRDSSSSLHSYVENSPFEAPRPEIGERSSSIQTMDRWFNNITEDGVTTAPAGEEHENIHQTTSSNASNPYTTVDSNFNDSSVFSASFAELTKYQHIAFETLTISELKLLKSYYDQLCSEVMSTKSGSKTSNEFLPDHKDATSI